MRVDKLWMNGEVVEAAEATTHVLSHSLHYGSGAFEGVRCYDGAQGPSIFRLGDHVDRLFYSAEVVGLQIPYTREQMAEACKQAVRANSLRSAYIRPFVFYGMDTLGVPPRNCPTECVVAAWEWGAYVSAEAPKIKTSRFLRIHPGSLDPEAKICGHYVNSLMAVREAHAEGFHEALLLDHEGMVAECSGENVFAVVDGTVYTPPRGNILPGITRATMFEIADHLGVPLEERVFDRSFLVGADEAFMTGTAAEVTPICQVDDDLISEAIGPISTRFRDTYQDAVHCRDERYRKHWNLLA